jgi:hypothetical protein
MVFRVLLDIFLVYLAYQFIFNFLVPVFKTTQQVKKRFREMHEQMNKSQNEGQYSSSQQAQSSHGPGKNAGDEYIDFEEIK